MSQPMNPEMDSMVSLKVSRNGLMASSGKRLSLMVKVLTFRFPVMIIQIKRSRSQLGRRAQPILGTNTAGWLEKRPAYIIHPNQGTKNIAWPICNGGCWNKPGGWNDGNVGTDDITKWHMYTTTFDSKTGKWAIYY